MIPEDFEVYDPKVDNQVRLTKEGLTGNKMCIRDRANIIRLSKVEECPFRRFVSINLGMTYVT